MVHLGKNGVSVGPVAADACQITTPEILRHPASPEVPRACEESAPRQRWKLFGKWRQRRNANRKFLKLFTPMGNFEAADVFIAGYPRSGNTWFQDLIAMTIYGVHPSFCPPLLAQNLVPDVHSRTYYQRYGTPMYFKTHFFPRPEYRRVVYLLRDGRDAMVSCYHYNQAFHDQVDFMEMIQTGKDLHHGRWQEHVNAWLANPYQAQMLVIKYEDLKQDAASELERFCKFVGVKRERRLLETVARETVFSKMQKRERLLGEGDPEWPAHKLFRRRGVVGSYQDEMPPEVLQAFMGQAGDTLKNCGYLDEPAHSNDPASFAERTVQPRASISSIASLLRTGR